MQCREDDGVSLGRSLGHSGAAISATGGSAEGQALIDAIMGTMRSGDFELALSLLKDATSGSLSLSSLEMPSLPSSLEGSQTVTLESLLHEIKGGQRSTSTERLQKLLSLDNLQVSGEGKESGQEGLLGMSGSSLGSLCSILSSILSSSSSTGYLTAGLLPLDNNTPDAPSNADTTLPFVVSSSLDAKMPPSSSPLQSASQQGANEAGGAQNMLLESLLDTAGNRHRGKRPLSGFGGAAHASPVGKAPRLFSTTSSDPSAVGGHTNELHKREDDGSMEESVDDCESSDSEVPAKKRRLAKSKGRRRVRQAEEASAEPPHHVPKSKYKGVSCHKQTLRWESSLWLNGRQVYLGGFATEQEAAHAYDLAALGCKGPSAEINFPLPSYADMTTELIGLSQDEVISWVRRRSNAFARGKSRFRGVSGRQGRWETRIGSFNGLKNVSFGVHEDEEMAGRMYDRAMILQKGRGAKTNFPMTDYDVEVAAYRAFCAERYGMLDALAAEEKSKAVTLPLDDFIEAEQLAAQGKNIKKKGRARKVKDIFAADLEAALMRN